SWVSLIYALGSKLPKHANQALFPQLRLAIEDDSENIRDLALKLIVALISNSGGQYLVEERQSIVPGTITFSGLGFTEASWVRTELLDNCLECVYRTIALQHKIQKAANEDWLELELTGLPLITQRCTRAWESIVKAIHYSTLQENDVRTAPETDCALSLLIFAEKVSQCDPETLIPGEWPDCDPEKTALLDLDKESVGYIVRADIVHYFLTCIVDIFSVESLVSARYQVREKIHGGTNDATHPMSESTPQTSDGVVLSQLEDSRDGTTLSPFEFILKCWQATSKSVTGTALEDPSHQALAIFMELSTKGIS
ncbi:hypothetical protein BX616_001307, partial [Lobosporangium transversale]